MVRQAHDLPSLSRPISAAATRDISSGPDWAAVLPGLVLTLVIASGAVGLRQVPGVTAMSPMILSILGGILIRNSVGLPSRARPGVVFALRRLLRIAIVLLGLQLTPQDVRAVGVPGLAVIVSTLVASFLVTTALGRLMGIERKLVELIAAGTSICGASAVIATNTVTEAPDEDVAYAVACVTIFGSVAMILYPLCPSLLHLGPRAFGLWCGASIHEIAQVVAAAFQDGREAGDFATVAKLSRVMMLAPTVIALSLLAARRKAAPGRASGRARPSLPWFVLGFVGLVVVNSLVAIPTEARTILVPTTTLFLSMALAAMGLETDILRLRAKGLRPLLLGFFSFAFIAAFSLVLVELAA